MKQPGVYVLRNKINGRCYVGSTTHSCIGRIKNHFWKLKKGIHTSKAMQKDFEEMGIEAFTWETLVTEAHPDLVLKLEAQETAKHKSLVKDGGYNNIAPQKKPSHYHGRPKTPDDGKVLFIKRVYPSMVNLLDEVVRSEGKVLTQYVVSREDGLPIPEATTPVWPSEHTEALLNDIVRLESEKNALEEGIKKVARMSNDERFNNLLAQYDKLKLHIKKLEEEKA